MGYEVREIQSEAAAAQNIISFLDLIPFSFKDVFCTPKLSVNQFFWAIDLEVGVNIDGTKLHLPTFFWSLRFAVYRNYPPVRVTTLQDTKDFQPPESVGSRFFSP